MPKDGVAPVTITCPFCMNEKTVCFNLQDPEDAMLIEQGKMECSNCGEKFAISGNITYNPQDFHE